MLIYRPTIISGSGYYSGSFDGDGSRLYNLISSSYAITASYALNGGGGGGTGVGFPFSGSAVITGSLTVSGSFIDFSKVEYLTGSSLIVNNITALTSLTASGLNYPSFDGIAGQVIETDGLGNLFFGNLDTIVENVKNVSGQTLYKGTPVHATGSGTLGNTVGVIAASASVASTMPATFILAQTLINEEEGLGIISGLIQGVNTSAFQNGQVIYVGANGGYTNVPPTGSNLIQNLGIVTKVHPTNGGGVVLGSGRANATPNLLNEQIFYGVNNRAVSRPLRDVISGSIFSYSGSLTGSIKLPTIPLGTSETNILLVDGTGNIVYRNNLSLTGSQGSQGYQGLSGAQGFQGYQGSVGLQGTTGLQGNQGSTGFQGNQGPLGNQGYQGVSGVNVSETFTVSASFSFTSSITVSHNFNSKNVIVSAYDSSDVYFIPQSIRLLDENRVKLTFTSPSTGYVVVAKGGHVVSGSLFTPIPGPKGLQGFQGSQGLQGNQGAQGAVGAQGIKGEIVNGLLYTTTISGSIITINHNTNNIFPLFSAYNKDKIAVQPKTVLSIDSNTIEVDFGTFFTGSISIGGAGLKGLKGEKGNFKGEKGTKGQKGNDIFPFTGTAIITGSLNVSNSSSFSHLLPKQDNLYDLGSPNKKWRDLYLTSASIYLGRTKISTNNQGRLSIINSENPSQKTIGDYSGSFTGSVKIPRIPQGSSETNIVLVNNDGDLVYRNNISLTGPQGNQGPIGLQGAQGIQGIAGSILGCAILHERLSSGVSSNVSFTNGTRVPRQINTIQFNTLGVTLSQSPNWRFTIPTAGTYKIIASGIYSRNRIIGTTTTRSAFSSRLMIRNETLAIDDVVIGENSRLHIYSTDPDDGQAMQQAILIGVITISSSTEFTLRQVCSDVASTANKTGGTAMSTPSGAPETYATVEIQRIS